MRGGLQTEVFRPKKLSTFAHGPSCNFSGQNATEIICSLGYIVNKPNFHYKQFGVDYNPDGLLQSNFEGRFIKRTNWRRTGSFPWAKRITAARVLPKTIHSMALVWGTSTSLNQPGKKFAFVEGEGRKVWHLPYIWGWGFFNEKNVRKNKKWWRLKALIQNVRVYSLNGTKTCMFDRTTIVLSSYRTESSFIGGKWVNSVCCWVHKEWRVISVGSENFHKDNKAITVRRSFAPTNKQ